MDSKKFATADGAEKSPDQASPGAPGRRSGVRKVLRSAGTVSLPGGQSREVTTWDVGREGVSVLTSKPISPGTRCSVSFEVPAGGGRGAVTAPAKVVYCSFTGADGFKVGLAFTGLDPDSESAIGEFTR